MTAATDTRTVVAGRAGQPARRRRRFRWGSVGRFVGLALIVLAFLGPIVWMLLASFKLNVQIYDPGQALIFEPTLENYGTVFDPRRGNYLVYIWNSFFVAFMATGLSLILAVPAAYAMSRFVMNKSSMVVLLARIIPGVSLLVPWYFIFAQMKLTGGYLPLILAHMFVSLPLILYIMMSFFDQLPEELEESAQVDGLTAIGAFFRITLPLSIPGIATATILSFIFSWNNFIFAVVLAGRETRTLPVAVFNVLTFEQLRWGALAAAALIVTLPVLVLAVLVQRQIVAGLTAGGMKG
jgi:multiple sugar transport system permease protein